MHRHYEQLARVAEATSRAVIITDRHGRIVWANDGFTEISGYLLGECVGKSPGSFLQGPETDRETTVRVGEAIRAGKEIEVQIINYSKVGEKYWIDLKIEPLFDKNGALDGFMAIEADITERIAKDEELRLLTTRFELATRAARIGIYTFDWQSGEIWWNDIAYEIFDRDPKQYRPSLESWRAMVHPDDLELVSTAMDGGDGLEKLRRIQYRILASDGSIRHIFSRGARSEDRAATRFTGSILDITDRIASENRERQLQKLLRESAHQAGMAEIATGVLHNVGNVLNSLGIANNTVEELRKAMHLERLEKAVHLLADNRGSLGSFLSEDVRGKHLPDYLSALATDLKAKDRDLYRELETVSKLINHLRDIVSVQQSVASVGGLSESIDLRTLAQSALLVQGSTLSTIKIEEEYEEMPPVVSDPHKLMQILVNFLRNAIDAVSASDNRPCRIVLRLTRDSSAASFSVTDSGIGMPPEVIAKLWQFGYTTKQKGHGYGLHNSANAARSIGASVTANSDGLGKGSCFTLRVPFQAPGEASGAVAA
jgi:PAS domain S-box-containing protein